MKCPFKFGNYDFEGAENCIGEECGMHKLCNANDTLAAENDVSAASMDANDVNAVQDSREKLEADVRKCFDPPEQQMLIRWLDRQAAITNSECRSEFDALDEHAQALERENAELKAKLDQMTVERDILQDCVDDLNADTSELQAKVDELTEQRDRWRSNWTERNMAYSELADDYQELEAKVDELTEQLESAYAKNRSLRAHIANMQDGRHGWHVKGAELQKQVDGLTAELTAARNAHAQAEHEAVILREKLGRALDYAHEITSVGGDC